MEAGAPEIDEVIIDLRIEGDAVTGPIIKVPFERYIKQGNGDRQFGHVHLPGAQGR